MSTNLRGLLVNSTPASTDATPTPSTRKEFTPLTLKEAQAIPSVSCNGDILAEALISFPQEMTVHAEIAVEGEKARKAVTFPATAMKVQAVRTFASDISLEDPSEYHVHATFCVPSDKKHEKSEDPFDRVDDKVRLFLELTYRTDASGNPTGERLQVSWAGGYNVVKVPVERGEKRTNNVKGQQPDADMNIVKYALSRAKIGSLPSTFRAFQIEGISDKQFETVKAAGIQGITSFLDKRVQNSRSGAVGTTRGALPTQTDPVMSAPAGMPPVEGAIMGR